VISISILDFKLFAEHIPFHSCFMLRENGNPDYVLSAECVLHYLETAEKLLSFGLSLEKIAEATGLTVEDVKGIASSIIKLSYTENSSIVRL